MKAGTAVLGGGPLLAYCPCGKHLRPTTTADIKAGIQPSCPDDSGSGNCYRVAAETVCQVAPTLLVCHGEPVGTGPANFGRRFGHAWIETVDGSWAIDLSNGSEVVAPRADYYRIGRIDPTQVRRYTYDETLAALTEHGHWGPWEDDR